MADSGSYRITDRNQIYNTTNASIFESRLADAVSNLQAAQDYLNNAILNDDNEYEGKEDLQNAIKEIIKKLKDEASSLTKIKENVNKLKNELKDSDEAEYNRYVDYITETNAEES
ncbi:MAG: hypothetical protein IJO27_00645 [Bacilli bacterium]|nr:hypothetical protein [Bacilli bacterium]